MTRHVSTEKLARYRDGELSRAGARSVAAHLAACARCQADADALAGLPDLLAATQLPPMPDHLAARIQTALAAESARRTAGEPEQAPARLRADRPSGRRSRRRFGPRTGLPRWVVTDEQARRHARRPGLARGILTAVATVAILGGGGYALFATQGDGSGSTATASGSSASRSDVNPAAGSPGSAPSAGSAGVNPPAVRNGGVRPGALAAPDFGPVVQYRRDGQVDSFTPVRTSTDYVAADLSQQASAALAKVRSPGPAIPGSAGTTGSGGHSPAGQGTTGGGTSGVFRAATLAQLPGCIGRVTGGQSVLLVDLATFQGAPAIIIVTGPPGSATGTQVWAVAAGCSSSGDRVLAHHQLPPPAP
ncbi:MAG TPA: zf-HC2 domain-containing protein [Streptosporangiaceae bacterium]|jgi:anti-sigma factor RsiW